MPKDLKKNSGFTTLRSHQHGFTLIELLVVIGILSVLLSITLIAINPTRQFQQANDTQRRSDVNAILNAISAYGADNKGALPTGVGGVAITTSAKTITSTVGANNIDLCSALTPIYIASMPYDPTTGSYTSCTTYNTGYTVLKSASGNRVTITATGEQTATISVTR